MQLAQGIGTITPPAGIPTTGGDPSSFVAGLIRASVSLLIIVSFVAAFIWIILAGLRFITASGDEKSIAQARSQIMWGVVGLVIVITSFAIIRLAETFFGVSIVSGGFQLPSR